MSGLPVHRGVDDGAGGHADMIPGGGEAARGDLAPGGGEGSEGGGAGGAGAGVIAADRVDPQVCQDRRAHVKRLAGGEGGNAVW